MVVQGITSGSSLSSQSGLGIESFSASVQYADDALILSSLNDDSVSLNKGFASKSLTVTAEEILFKLNQLLATHLPQGIQSLKPEETTAEATASRVVDGISLLFETFKKQNTNLDAEELITKFMEQARKGVEQGYTEAFNILEGLGAFGYDGVQSGVEKTKTLIEEKLKIFESKKREELGVVSETQSETKTAVLAQAAGSLSVVA